MIKCLIIHCTKTINIFKIFNIVDINCIGHTRWRWFARWRKFRRNWASHFCSLNRKLCLLFKLQKYKYSSYFYGKIPNVSVVFITKTFMITRLGTIQSLESLVAFINRSIPEEFSFRELNLLTRLQLAYVAYEAKLS